MICPVCGAKGYRAAMIVDASCGETKHKCRNCWHTWFSLPHGYDNQYHETTIKWKYNDLVKRNEYHQKRIDALSLVMEWPPKSVLDVGCGDGQFLTSVDSGIRVGTDVNKAIEIPSDISYIQGPFIDVDIDNRFELVTSFHALEHVVDCTAFCKKMLSLSYSVVVVEVPISRKMVRFNGHVHGFNIKSFKKFINTNKGNFSTIGFYKGIQGSSSLWIGKKR